MDALKKLINDNFGIYAKEFTGRMQEAVDLDVYNINLLTEDRSLTTRFMSIMAPDSTDAQNGYIVVSPKEKLEMDQIIEENFAEGSP